MIMGAWGDHEKGWPAVEARYHWAAARFRDSGAALEVEYLTAFESGDLAVTTAIERAVVRIDVPPFARRHAAAGRRRSGAAQRSTAAVRACPRNAYATPAARPGRVFPHN